MKSLIKNKGPAYLSLLLLLLLLAVTTNGNPVSTPSPTTLAEVALSQQRPRLGDSVLLDKETGRVYWQSGALPNTSYMMKQFKHVKASVLSVILLSTLLQKLILDVVNIPIKLIWVKALVKRLVPQFSKGFIIVCVLLYLLEAATCSTRKYLSNIVTPAEFESKMEELRRQPPEVTWTVRCYHYERRLDGLGRQNRNESHNGSRKVITHTAKKKYIYESWIDNSVMGLWERSQADTDRIAPFSKLSLCKMLVLSDIKTRESYFRQQANFVAIEGHSDDHAEFSTKIDVPGYKPKMLVVRTVIGAPSTGMVKLPYFWLFTIIGMTVPYRMWFSSHCDDLSVTLMKETSATVKKSASSWSSLWKSEEPNEEELYDQRFRNTMQRLNLFAPKPQIYLKEAMERPTLAKETSSKITEAVTSKLRLEASEESGSLGSNSSTTDKVENDSES